MDDDILLPAVLSYRPESPFFAKAQYVLARSMYGRNTHVFLANDFYSFVAFNTQFLGILHALWSRLDPAVPQPTRLYPKAADAAVLAWYMETFIPPGTVGPLGSWSATPEPHPLPPIDYSSTWFAPHTEFPTPYAPPAWASYQRRYARTLRNVGSWWMEERLLGSELGGGGGDDTEAAGALAVPTVIKSEGPYHPFERGVKKVLEGVLFGPEVNQDQGFVDPPGGVMDPEHAGEYTTYPLFFLLPAYYGSPRYLEFAMRTIRNMIEPPDPILGDTAWTGIPGWTQWRHFKAFRVGP